MVSVIDVVPVQKQMKVLETAVNRFGRKCSKTEDVLTVHKLSIRELLTGKEKHLLKEMESSVQI